MTATTTNLSNRQLKRLLNAIGACGDGTRWLGDRDLTTAWTECPNGAHLLWVCARIGVDRRLIVGVAAREWQRYRRLLFVYWCVVHGRIGRGDRSAEPAADGRQR